MKDYSFGNYICALRQGHGLSQFQLGALVGVTDKAVSKWENGSAKPKLSTCIRLASVLDIPIDELLSCKGHSSTTARKDFDHMNQKLWKEAYNRLTIYGDIPPAVCWSRLATEEQALRDTNAIQIFSILGKLEEEARKMSSVFYVAGTISSSFVAWLFGGTKVNPLPPHYRCPKCGKTEFVKNTADGFDLPPKTCTCGAEFLRDGHNIPFEGYCRNKQRGPDVEIRVSEAFKPIAVSIIKSFYENTATVIPINLTPDENSIDIDRLLVYENGDPAISTGNDIRCMTSEQCWNWQKTYPSSVSFTLVPSTLADNIQSAQKKLGTNIVDSHFLYTPQMLKHLYQKRLQDHPITAKLLPSEESLSFSLLLKLDAIIHSTGSWTMVSQGDQRSINEDILLCEGRTSFREIPVFREDILNDISIALRKNGITDHGLALQMMRDVGRRGKYKFKGMPIVIEEIIKSLDLPEWYPDYLKRVAYLFPKGHCIAALIAEVAYEWVCSD